MQSDTMLSANTPFFLHHFFKNLFIIYLMTIDNNIHVNVTISYMSIAHNISFQSLSKMMNKINPLFHI